MGDVKEMYHQIFVSPKDRDALRFVWRKFSTDPIKDYRMNVHKLVFKSNRRCKYMQRNIHIFQKRGVPFN